jgi:hypothetical protein
MVPMCKRIAWLLASVLLCVTAAFASNEELNQSELLARNSIRVINTLQRYELTKTGRYLSLAELRTSPMLRTLRNNPQADIVGLGRLTIDEMAFDRAELVPGYKITLTISRARVAYSILFANETMSLRSFSSDERGVIYQGGYKPPSFIDEPGRASALLNKAHPIVRENDRAAAPLASSDNRAARLTLIAFPAPSDGPSICGLEGGTCTSTGNAIGIIQSGGCCWNLGYEDCPWCCKSSCN